MKKNIQIGVVLLVTTAIVLSGCNFPAFAPMAAQEAPPPVIVVTATPEPVQQVQCEPTVTATVNANVRYGPDTIYTIAGVLPQGGSAKVVGRNDAFSWYYIVFPGGPGGYGWIAASVTSASCLPAVLQIVAAPPPPVAAAPQQPQNNSGGDSGGSSGGDSGGSSGGGSGGVDFGDLLIPGLLFTLWTPTPTPIDFDWPMFDFDEIPDFGF